MFLNTIFDDATSREEREKAIASLKKTTGKDPAGLVERYTAATTKAGSGIEAAQIAQVVKLSVENTGLKQKIEDLKADLRRRDQMEALLLQGHQAEIGRLKAQLRRVTAELATMKSPVFPEIKCAAPGCANMFRPRRRDHTICSDNCRKAISRARKHEAIRPPDAREA